MAEHRGRRPGVPAAGRRPRGDLTGGARTTAPRTEASTAGWSSRSPGRDRPAAPAAGCALRRPVAATRVVPPPRARAVRAHPRRPDHELQRERHPRHLAGALRRRGWRCARGHGRRRRPRRHRRPDPHPALQRARSAAAATPPAVPAASTRARCRRPATRAAAHVPAVQDRRRRQQVHRVPHHRHGQLGAGLLGRRAAALRQAVAGDQDRALRRQHPVGVRHREQPGRPVLLPARQDRLHRRQLLHRSSRTSSVPAVGRWRRSTSSPTSTATPCRTSSGCSAGRSRTRRVRSPVGSRSS